MQGTMKVGIVSCRSFIGELRSLLSYVYKLLHVLNEKQTNVLDPYFA